MPTTGQPGTTAPGGDRPHANCRSRERFQCLSAAACLPPACPFPIRLEDRPIATRPTQIAVRDRARTAMYRYVSAHCQWRLGPGAISETQKGHGFRAPFCVCVTALRVHPLSEVGLGRPAFGSLAFPGPVDKPVHPRPDVTLLPPLLCYPHTLSPLTVQKGSGRQSHLCR